MGGARGVQRVRSYLFAQNKELPREGTGLLHLFFVFFAPASELTDENISLVCVCVCVCVCNDDDPKHEQYASEAGPGIRKKMIR